LPIAVGCNHLDQASAWFIFFHLAWLMKELGT
jgi:hypothetical protein